MFLDTLQLHTYVLKTVLPTDGLVMKVDHGTEERGRSAGPDISSGKWLERASSSSRCCVSVLFGTVLDGSENTVKGSC